MTKKDMYEKAKELGVSAENLKLGKPAQMEKMVNAAYDFKNKHKKK